MTTTQPPVFTPGAARGTVIAHAAEHRDAIDDVRREIFASLRQSFARLIQSEYGRAAEPDPVLGSLMLAMADQIAPLYEALADSLPSAVLEELMRGIDVPLPSAHPAQTVVQFSLIDRPEWIRRTRTITGRRPDGRAVQFALDHPLHVSPVTLACAAVYEPPADRGGRGTLELVPGAMGPGDAEVPRARAAVDLRDAPPALYLALASDDADADLSGLSFFIDTGSAETPVARSLGRSAWHLLGDDGPMRLRARTAGPRRLEWVRPTADDAPSSGGDDESDYPVFAGYYDRMLWVLPSMPARQCTRTRAPATIADTLRRLLPPGSESTLDVPHVWLRVPLDPAVRGVAAGIHRIALHAMSASNVARWDTERLEFDRRGRAVVLLPDGNRERHIVHVLGVSGASGSAYMNTHEHSDIADTGRYRLRDRTLEITPREANGSQDPYVRVSLLLTDGELATGLDTDFLQSVERGRTNPTLKAAALTPTRGGTAPPTGDTLRLNLAHHLRTRDRVVTAADVELTARAFDPRVETVTVEPVRLERAGTGLRPVVPLRVAVRPGIVDESEPERHQLGERLEARLLELSPVGQSFRVTVVEATEP